MSLEREYRFLGGPWHGERHMLDGRHAYLVPVPEPFSPIYVTEGTIATAQPGMLVAVYLRQGDYPAEWFYRFDRLDRF